MNNIIQHKKQYYSGIAFALFTVTIWSINYVIARGIAQQITPISFAFLRWATATMVIIPVGYKKLIQEKNIVLQHKTYFFFTALTGVSLFNTLIYIAGHYTSAINLVLIGTTASPIFITILAAFFLKERIYFFKIIGMILCFAGIVILLTNGSMNTLIHFHFGIGDIWMLVSAFMFSTYSILARKKPTEVSPTVFLIAVFTLGTLLLLPFFIAERIINPPIHFTKELIGIIIYLGAINSAVGFLCWNAALARIGAAKTAMFANLMPVFSAIEAVLILGESFTTIHLISGFIVIAGLIIANLKNSFK